MAKQIVSRLEVVPADGVVVDATLHQVSAIDAIHQATAILEHLAEVMGVDAQGVETNASFGQHLLFTKIATQLRVALDQLIAERSKAPVEELAGEE